VIKVLKETRDQVIEFKACVKARDIKGKKEGGPVRLRSSRRKWGRV